MTEAQEFELQCSAMPSVTIYSDGSFKPALGTGGYGTIMTCNGYTRFFYGGFVGNVGINAMETLAPLQAIRSLNTPCRITIISDSQYLVKGINEWLPTWVANDWRKSDGGRIANEELWKEMWMWCQHHIISAVWVKGHSVNFSNSICDNFATIGAHKSAGVSIPYNLLNRR